MAFNFFSRCSFALGPRAIRVSILPSKFVRHATHPHFRKVPGLGFTAAAAVGLGLSTILTRGKTYCDPSIEQASPSGSPIAPPSREESSPPPPVSSVSMYELTFGTVTGVCAGIFLKKGIKALAFLLGATFVVLQYMGSVSILRVDWARMERRFEEIFYTADNTGKQRVPTIAVAWRALTNFLLADFPPRASFMAGMILGLRIG